MQANNDPKWTDDAAFWNEAWADMDKRLDQESPSDRKAMVIWWRKYGWLLGLILLVTAVATPAAVAYFSEDEPLHQQHTAPQMPATPAPLPAEVIAAKEEEPSPQQANTAPGTTNQNVESNGADRQFDDGKENKHALAASTPAPVSKPVPNLIPTLGETASNTEERLATFPSTADIVTTGLGESDQNALDIGLRTREIPAALLSLESLPIESVALSQHLGLSDLNAVVPNAKLAARLYLEAGTSSGLQGNSLGYYAGLQYSLPVSKRFSIPLGVRVRRDFHQFVTLAESGTPVRFLDIDNSTTATAPDTLLFEFSSENLEEVKTTGFEGRIGLAYTASPRLRIGASLSLNYLQTAIARLSPQYQQEFAADQNRFLNADADITLVNGLSFAREDASVISPNSPLLAGGGGVSNLPRFNQWVAYGGIDLAYDLTPRLSFNLAGRRLLAQPDQSEVLGLQRGQIEMGIRWRLK